MKTQTQHTPGPWQTTDLGRDIGIVPTSQPLSRNIAVCSRLYREDAVDCEANARLIAAAPDLLAALESIADTCDTPPRNRPVAWDMFCSKIARAAIAKAKGVQS